MIDNKFLYLIGCGLFAVVWLPIFIFRPSLRLRMLVVGARMAPVAAFVELLHRRDYWHPKYAIGFGFAGVEDLIAGFLIGGLGSVVFDAISGGQPPPTGPTPRSPLPTMMCVGWLAVFWMTFGLGVNSIYSVSLVSACCGAYLVFRQPSLWLRAVGGGVLFAACMFADYSVLTTWFPTMFQDYWKLERLSGLFVGPVPIEELGWAFSWGFVAGPLSLSL